jgi:hypothetical protein
VVGDGDTADHDEIDFMSDKDFEDRRYVGQRIRRRAAHGRFP